MTDQTIYVPGYVRTFDRKKAEETRTIPFTISSNARDRHHSRLNMNNWHLDNYRANPIVGYQHHLYGDDLCSRPSPDDVIGMGSVKIVEETDRSSGTDRKLLVGEVKFEPKEINEDAEKIFQKVLFGTLRATSVGFLPVGQGSWGEGDEARGAENETYYYAGQELVEFSIVNIPSNPEAIRRAGQDFTAKALKAIRQRTGLTFGDIEKLSVGDLVQILKSGKLTKEGLLLPESSSKGIKTPTSLNIVPEQFRSSSKPQETEEAQPTPGNIDLFKRKLKTLELL